MALAALLTFVLVVSATKGSTARLRVAAARTDLPAGARLTPESLRLIDIPADAALARATVPWDQVRGGDRVTAHPIAAGELLRPTDMVAGAGNGANGLRAMSIPAKRERAAGGILRVGDRVDVLDVVDGAARWVVAGVQVIEVPGSSPSAGITRDAGALYDVVVEVDATQALALAEALTHDTVSVIRSTGAAPATTGKTTSAADSMNAPPVPPSVVPPSTVSPVVAPPPPASAPGS